MTRTRLDRVGIVLLVLIAIGTAILSFSGLTHLARMAGYSGSVLGIPLAALYALMIDIGAVASTVAWLHGEPDDRRTSYARKLALTLIGVSLVGNVAAHTVDAQSWWAGIGIGVVASVAPFVLAAVVHLLTMPDPVAPPVPEEGDPVETPAEVVEEVAEESGLPFVALTPRRTTCHVYRLFNADDALLYVGVGYDVAERCRKHKRKKTWWPEVVSGSITTYPTRRDALRAETEAIATEEPLHNVLPGSERDHACPPDDPDWTPSDPIATRENVPAVELHAPTRPEWVVDDQTLADRVVRWSETEGAMPSRERIRKEYGIGSKRAERVRGLALAASEPDLGPDSLTPDPDPLTPEPAQSEDESAA